MNNKELIKKLLKIWWIIIVNVLLYIIFLKLVGFKNFLNKYDKWYGYLRDVGGDSNKSIFIW